LMDALLPFTSVCKHSSERAVCSISLTITYTMRYSSALLTATDSDNVLRAATFARLPLSLIKINDPKIIN
ncbi:hypothetical protein ACVGXT_19835, partial [Enterobacter intestinihominis]